ncbi:MAG: DUF255 domain-containing protein [Pseudomonadota bacterium]
MNHKFLALMALLWSSIVSAEIEWRHWEANAFRAAKAQNLPIMVNVGHEGCTACRWMERNTFSDREVSQFVNQNFIAIQVDSEARPDIGERYSDWAWPATAFLKPDGQQAFAIRGSRRPDDFLKLLERVVERHQAGELRNDGAAPYVAAANARTGPLREIQAQVRAQLDGAFDRERGGWGAVKVLEVAEPTLQMFARGYLYGDKDATEGALKTAAGFSRQVDPVWGGVFYASFDSWTNTVKELRLESQAAGLAVFADALQVSGDERYVEALERLVLYLTEQTQAQNGLFYGSQKDLIEGLPTGLSAKDYYGMSANERLKFGKPATDTVTYSDLNARAIWGLSRAYQASGDEAFLGAATDAARALRKRQTGEGWLRQLPLAAVDAGTRVHAMDSNERPYLRAQAHGGLAFLAMYQLSADDSWLRAARGVLRGMRILQDEELGGYYASPLTPVEGIVGGRKPLEDNAVAARFVYWMGVLNQDDKLKADAEAVIRSVALPNIVAREGKVTGNLAMTLELLINGYVEFSIVGEVSDPRANALHSEALRFYEPRKLVHYEAPGRYPDLGKPAMYICNDQQCTVPIFKPEDVATQAASFAPEILAKHTAMAR